MYFLFLVEAMNMSLPNGDYKRPNTKSKREKQGHNKKNKKLAQF